jgi:hypothetical protein
MEDGVLVAHMLFPFANLKPRNKYSLHSKKSVDSDVDRWIKGQLLDDFFLLFGLYSSKIELKKQNPPIW